MVLATDKAMVAASETATVWLTVLAAISSSSSVAVRFVAAGGESGIAGGVGGASCAEGEHGAGSKGCGGGEGAGEGGDEVGGGEGGCRGEGGGEEGGSEGVGDGGGGEGGGGDDSGGDGGGEGGGGDGGGGEGGGGEGGGGRVGGKSGGFCGGGDGMADGGLAGDGGVPGGAEGTNRSRPSRACTPTRPTETRLLSAAWTRIATVASLCPGSSPRAALRVAAMSKPPVTSPLKLSVKVPAVSSVPLSRTCCTSYNCAWLLLLTLPARMSSFMDMPRPLTG